MQTKQPKQLTEVEALTRITRVLNQLSAESRKRVLAFLADVTESIGTVLAARKLYIVKPQHPTLGEIALEAYGLGKACDAVALQGDDLATLLAEIGAACAEILNGRASRDAEAHAPKERA